MAQSIERGLTRGDKAIRACRAAATGNRNVGAVPCKAMNAGMASGDAGTILPIDAIDEFKTGENPKAEYGWKPGAIVNVGIKSGTNGVRAWRR